ncbi:MAG: L-serine ammonia-lyase [Fusobacteriaceae bacterium]
MKTLRELYKIGNGPSSSHTMGPEKASQNFKQKYSDANSYKVELWGSLAATGKGHLTDWIIEKTLSPKKVEIIWKPEFVHAFHPNGMKFFALDQDKKEIGSTVFFSVGGGSIIEEGQNNSGTDSIYTHDKMSEILWWCNTNNKKLWEYVDTFEDSEIWDYLDKVFVAMEEAVELGISKTGVLPGSLKYPRKSKEFLEKANLEKTPERKKAGKIFAYTLAVSEENASGGRVVTAPTCGSCGIIPGLLYYYDKEEKIEKKELLRGLAIAGLVGNLIKENASISGAEAGCQAEIGSACSMAAAMVTYFIGGSNAQIEYAAEIALEHHLGLTCDPVGGYVQVPCIERNAISSMRAIDAAFYASLTDGNHNINLDRIIYTMGVTGKDLKSEYKETSQGGLAKFYFGVKC